MSYKAQIQGLKQGPDIIVATPGRLIDHIDRGRVDLSGIEMLILDEADRMLDMGFIDDVNFIANKTPKERQTLLFSATVDNRINKIVNKLLKQPKRINLSENTPTIPGINKGNQYHKLKNAKRLTAPTATDVVRIVKRFFCYLIIEIIKNGV